MTGVQTCALPIWQIIEIGAVMVQDGRIIDEFSSFVKAIHVPPIIEELTGITLKDLENAPSLKSVLSEFKLLIKDAIFVAHNAGFDYNFISNSLERSDLGVLLNRQICTIDLAQKTIISPRYGLDFLSEYLNLTTQDRHRALGDARIATELFLKSLKLLPSRDRKSVV